MKIKRDLLFYILIFLAAYSVGYMAEYGSCKRGVEGEINELFKKSAPFFHDSIRNITGRYLYSLFDSNDINKRQDMIYVSKDGELKISRDIIKIEGAHEYHNKQLETFLLQSKKYDLNIADSIWNRQLREHGYGVEAILFLSTKNLYDMFPRRDTLDANLRPPFMSVHTLGGKEYFVTDSVGLGICNQGYIVSHVHVPALVVLGHIKWYGTALLVAIIALLLSLVIASFRKYRAERKSATRYKAIAEALDVQNDGQNIVIGNILYNVEESTLYNTVSRQQLKLPRTQARIMKMLVTSEDYYVTKIEICKELWDTDEKQATKSYNSACKRLRGSLECIDGVNLLTIKDTAIQLEIVE